MYLEIFILILLSTNIPIIVYWLGIQMKKKREEANDIKGHVSKQIQLGIFEYGGTNLLKITKIRDSIEKWVISMGQV